MEDLGASSGVEWDPLISFHQTENRINKYPKRQAPFWPQQMAVVNITGQNFTSAVDAHQAAPAGKTLTAADYLQFPGA